MSHSQDPLVHLQAKGFSLWDLPPGQDEEEGSPANECELCAKIDIIYAPCGGRNQESSAQNVVPSVEWVQNPISIP